MFRSFAQSNQNGPGFHHVHPVFFRECDTPIIAELASPAVLEYETVRIPSRQKDRMPSKIGGSWLPELVLVVGAHTYHDGAVHDDCKFCIRHIRYPGVMADLPTIDAFLLQGAERFPWNHPLHVLVGPKVKHVIRAYPVPYAPDPSLPFHDM